MVAPLELEATPSGDVFTHIWEHPTNLELIEGDSRARKLEKKQVKQLNNMLSKIVCTLSESRYYQALEAIDKHTNKMKDLDLLLVNLDENAHPKRQQQLETAIQKHEKRIKIIRKQIAPLRKKAIRADRIQKRLEEHEIALKNEMLYAKLRQEMKKEVHFFASQCIERWSALGFRQEIHLKRKRILRRVQFEKCVVTEDEIQFKIRVSDLTLLHSVKHHLPHGVRVAELVSIETLAELSAACQRPVTSPHNDEEKDFSNGAYIIVHRVGMNDGLFNYIRLADILVKYNQGERERYPFPIGVRRGRVAQYGYLDTQPHMMFNGITGSGKTNAIRAMLTTLIQYHSPSELRLFITDLKRGADFNHFKDLPHIGGEIITDIDGLADLTYKLVGMMRNRMETIAKRAQFDIKGYNAIVSDESKMSRVIVVIDECSAINSLGDKDQTKGIWKNLALLSTQARASGIHLFLGTQQSFSDAIKREVRDNITLVVSGRQRTLAGSMGTFGDGRAKNLPNIPGRMYCYDGDLYMVQTPHATNEDIEKAVKIAMQWDEPKPLDLPQDTVNEVLANFEETVLNMALNDFDGKLVARPIWDKLNNPEVSQNMVTSAVKDIVSQETITYNGTEYEIKREKKYYILVPKNSETEKLTHTA